MTAICAFETAEQVDGYQPSVIDTPPAAIITPIERAEAFVAATGASISHGGGRTFYRPSTDSILMPPRAAFIGTPTSAPAEKPLLFDNPSRADALDERTEFAAIASSGSVSGIRPTRSRSWSPNSAPRSFVPISASPMSRARITRNISRRGFSSSRPTIKRFSPPHRKHRKPQRFPRR